MANNNFLQHVAMECESLADLTPKNVENILDHPLSSASFGKIIVSNHFVWFQILAKIFVFV